MVESATARPVAEFAALVTSFELSLEARNRAERTIRGYLYDVALFGQFLAEQGMPTAPRNIKREHVESFIRDQIQRNSPATARTRYKTLQAFFKFAMLEDEITVSPMARMEPPKVADDPPPVVGPEQLRALLKACEGRLFRERRDMALLMLMIDAGVRREEASGVDLDDIDLRARTVWVTGKGGRRRQLQLGIRAAQAIDRYIRVRAANPYAEIPALFIGRAGRMTGDGIYSAVQRRAKQAGLGRIHPHQFRHTWAHEWLSDDGAEGDLMQLAGWNSPAMLRRYGRSAAAARARTAARKHSLGDRL